MGCRGSYFQYRPIKSQHLSSWPGAAAFDLPPAFFKFRSRVCAIGYWRWKPGSTWSCIARLAAPAGQRLLRRKVRPFFPTPMRFWNGRASWAIFSIRPDHRARFTSPLIVRMISSTRLSPSAGASAASRVTLLDGAADCLIHAAEDGTKVQLCRIAGLGHHWPGVRLSGRYKEVAGMFGPLGPPIDLNQINDEILRFLAGYALPHSAPHRITARPVSRQPQEGPGMAVP